MRHTILCTALLCACTDEVPAHLQHDATVEASLDVADASQDASVDAPVSMDATDGGFDAQ